MRCDFLARALITAAIVAILVRAGTLSCVQARGPSKPATPFPTFEKMVEGKPAATRERALEFALSRAQEVIAAFLKESQPSLTWSPPTAYIREHLLREVDQPEDESWEKKDINGHSILVQEKTFEHADETAYIVKIKVGVSAQDLASIQKLQQADQENLRHQIAYERQVWLGKILIGVVALLLAAAGYIRLEDATKGYYTTWLRLGLVGVAGAVGAGIWLAT